MTKLERASKKLMVAAVLLLSIAASGTAFAQDSRVELSASIGNAQPQVVVRNPQLSRSPVTYSGLSDSYDLWLTGVDVRAYWHKRFSVLLQVAIGNNPQYSNSFRESNGVPPGPAQRNFTVAQTVERHQWTISLLQSFDLIPRGRVRPWIGVGGMFIHAGDHYNLAGTSITDPTDRFEDVVDVDRSSGALLVQGGVRVYLDSKIFFSADESVRSYLDASQIETFNALWRVGIGVSF